MKAAAWHSESGSKSFCLCIFTFKCSLERVTVWCLARPNIHPIYDLLEHVKGPDL